MIALAARRQMAIAVNHLPCASRYHHYLRPDVVAVRSFACRIGSSAMGVSFRRGISA